MQQIIDYFDLCERALEDQSLMFEVQEAALALLADKRPLAFKAQTDWVIASLPFLLSNPAHHERFKTTVATWRQLLLDAPEFVFESYGFLLSDPIQGLEKWRINPEIATICDSLEVVQTTGFALRLDIAALLERDMPDELRAELENLQSLL